MAKRKQSGIDVVASMPWQAGIVLGLVGYLAIRYGIGWTFTATNNPYLRGMGRFAATGIYTPLGWLLLAGCWIAALASFLKRRKRRHLLDTQTGMDSLRAMRWDEFEMLAGEAFRRQGYQVTENGLGGADGGIDLILHKDGRTTLVQCKQWQSWQVGVKVVREMFGLLVHHRADAMKIVALSDFTSDARRFAQGKPIELIHGGELIATVRSTSRNGRQPGIADSTWALAGACAAGLLIIALLPGAPKPYLPPPQIRAAQPAPPPRLSVLRAPAPSASWRPMAANTSSSRTTRPDYRQTPQTDAELRDWKRRNAEAMKILEKTTAEVPLQPH